MPAQRRQRGSMASAVAAGKPALQRHMGNLRISQASLGLLQHAPHFGRVRCLDLELPDTSQVRQGFNRHRVPPEAG